MAERRERVKRLAAAQLRRLALWVPVLIGLGVAWRLQGWGRESAGLAIALGALAALFLAGRGRPARIAGLGLISVLAGVTSGEVRLRSVDAPRLEAQVSGPVSGRVLGVDRSRSGAPRVLLDRVEIAALHPDATPIRVRIALLREMAPPEIGTRIALKATLGPPPGPAEPGGFDFSRAAWLGRLGAVGYSRARILSVSAGAPSALATLNRARAAIAGAIAAGVGGDAGAVAAALAVGDRSRMPEATVEALRDSGLAHLLAISGLHVGLLAGLIYTAMRLALALSGAMAEHRPVRKIAAIAALLGAAGYLALSGTGIATQRAFIMAAVAFGAILIDRPAVTLRGLALAASLVLVIRPESLFEAGFQMSFAAAAALVAAYEASRDFWRARSGRRSLRGVLTTFALATLVTSLVAGLATAPFAAFHFNRLVLFGLPANVLATPLMGLWIMPCLILAALLAPFGLQGLAFAVLAPGINTILGIAGFFAAQEGAVAGVAAFHPLALAAMVSAGLWAVLWRGAIRALALAPLLFGMLVTTPPPRPDVLVSAGAGLIGVLGSDGRRWISRERADSYAAATWLRRDGDLDIDQSRAFDRRSWSCKSGVCSGEIGDGARLLLALGQRIPACDSGDLLIAPRRRIGERDCTVLDARRLSGASSVAIHLRSGRPPRIETAHRWTPSPFFGRAQ